MPTSMPRLKVGKPFVWEDVRRYWAMVRSSQGELVDIMHAEPEVLPRLKKLGPKRHHVLLWLCSGGTSAFSGYLPYADEIGLHAFEYDESIPPKQGELIWPGFNHPRINRARVLRHFIVGKGLFAIMRFGVPDRIRGGIVGRPQSPEELQWMVLAAIGASYDGILWENEPGADLPGGKAMHVMGANLAKYTDDLGSTVPVGWAKSDTQDPVSALRSDKKLFVVVLNPGFLVSGAGGGAFQIPLETKPREGEVAVELPPGWDIEDGRALSGETLSILRRDGAARAKYRFTGGGEMLVFDLKKSVPGPTSHSAAERTSDVRKGEQQ